MNMGNVIVILILIVIVGFCIRSIYRDHKSGGCGSCNGCSGGSCGSCGGGDGMPSEYTITIKKKKDASKGRSE